MTETEKILWNRLKERQINGFKFRKQHPIDRYILDFYCHEKKVAIEIDGDSHKDREEYDTYRDRYLKSIDVKTLRFKAIDIIENIDFVLSKIKKNLTE